MASPHIGTGGSERGLEIVREHGADVAISHHEAGYVDEIRRVTKGRGVDVILEMAAHVNLERDLGLLARDGRIVVIGSRGANGNRRAPGNGPRRRDSRHVPV